jgi:hypothetical protein
MTRMGAADFVVAMVPFQLQLCAISVSMTLRMRGLI